MNLECMSRRTVWLPDRFVYDVAANLVPVAAQMVQPAAPMPGRRSAVVKSSDPEITLKVCNLAEALPSLRATSALI